jgi:hypothetical protein
MILVTKRFRWLGLLMILLSGDAQALAEDQLEPGDPIAAIDGEPVYLGELNLILTERFRLQDLEAIPIEVQRATALLLVRRHLALKTLEAQGGDALRSLIGKRIEAFAAEAKRRGSSVEQQAKARASDEKSLNADLAWRVVWGEYLKSKMTEQNLRRFFDKHPQTYGGDGSFDELVDQSKLRRDAANALFENLVAAQRDVKIDWFVATLRPPDQVTDDPVGESSNQPNQTDPGE